MQKEEKRESSTLPWEVARGRLPSIFEVQIIRPLVLLAIKFIINKWTF